MQETLYSSPAVYEEFGTYERIYTDRLFFCGCHITIKVTKDIDPVLELLKAVAEFSLSVWPSGKLPGI